MSLSKRFAKKRWEPETIEEVPTTSNSVLSKPPVKIIDAQARRDFLRRLGLGGAMVGGAFALGRISGGARAFGSPPANATLSPNFLSLVPQASRPAAIPQGGMWLGTDEEFKMYDGTRDVFQRYPVFNVKSYGAKGDNGTDDTAAIQAAIDAAQAATRLGVVHFPAGRYICGNITIASSSVGLRIRGEYVPLQNALSVGSVIVAKSGAIGTIWKLSTAIHSNDFIIEDLGFDTNGVNINMCDFSQAELASYFHFQNCWWLGNSNMTAGKYLLNIDGNEDTILVRCAFSPNGSAGDSLLYHLTGGDGSLYSCQLGGNIKLAGLSMTLVGCVQGGPIWADTSISLINYVLVGHWIESGALGGVAFRNDSGQNVRYTAIGGRWNQASSRAYFGGTTQIEATLEGVILNSNDATTCNLLTNAGDIAHVRNCQFVNGATRNLKIFQGFQSGTTPAIPATGVYAQNTFTYPMKVYILTVGTVTAWNLKDLAGTAKSFAVGLTIGQEITLGPSESISFTYAGAAPTWVWNGTTE